MTEPYISEIRIFGFDFPPRGWAHCDGQILPIEQNQALFSFLGTRFGGDGRTDFGLPDLRGRTPVNFGSHSGVTTRSLGAKGGEENVTLTENEMPAHTHNVNASSADFTSRDPTNRFPAANTGILRSYQDIGSTTNTFDANIISQVGGSALNNMQPYLALNFCIALEGTFPPRN